MNPASDQKSQLEIAAWELRQKLAGRRGVPIPAKPEPSSKPLASSVSASVATAVHAIDFDVGDDGPQNAVDICLVARNEPVPVPTPANPAPFSGMFSTAFESVESIIESVGGKIADLMRTYGVTETHKEA